MTYGSRCVLETWAQTSATHLAAEDPDQPESTGEYGEQNVEDEVGETVTTVGVVLSHDSVFLS